MTRSDVTSSPEKAAGKRYGCLLYTLSFLAVVSLVIGLSYVVWYSNAMGELDTEISGILSRGEPLWFSDLAPKDVDPEQDATPLFLLAMSKL